MADLASVKVKVQGRVKGIGYRAFVISQARVLGLAGYVRNLPDENAVELEAEGERSRLEQLIARLKAGPPLSRVTKVDVNWSEYAGKYSDFSIR